MGFGNGLVTNGINSVDGFIVLGVLLLAVFAFIDALVRPAAAYESAGKLTKVAWLIFLGIAVFYDAMWGSVFGILTILGVIATIVYVVDVRPALRQLTNASKATKGGGAPRGGRW